MKMSEMCYLKSTKMYITVLASCLLDDETRFRWSRAHVCVIFYAVRQLKCLSACCPRTRVTGLAETTACLSCLWLSITLQSEKLSYVFSLFFSIPLCVYVCVCVSVFMNVCEWLYSIGFRPVWHIWMCLARSKFLNTNPQALHNPPLLCNDCCSSLAAFALSSFSCPTPCRPASFTIAAPEHFLPLGEEFNQLSCEAPAFLTHYNKPEK